MSAPVEIPSDDALAAELRAVTEDDAYAQPWTFGQKCIAAADRIDALRAEVARLTATLEASQGESARLRARMPEVRGKLHDIMCLPDEAGALVVAQNWARAIEVALAEARP